MRNPSTLLVYEPAPALSQLLQEQLDGWRVTHVADAGDLSVREAQAVLLAEDADHPAIAAALRQAGMIGPIFSLKEDAPPPLIALARPLRLPALMARLQAQDGSFVDGAIIGPWRLDIAQRAITHRNSGAIERLTDKELSLLTLLLTSTTDTVERERLQTEIWRYHAEADTHTVETHVWRLRQKLEVDPAMPQFLLTGNDGYYLNRYQGHS